MMWGRRFGISVGRRIAFLVIVQAVTMTMLVVHVVRAFTDIADDLDYSGRFIIEPTEALPAAIENAASIEAALVLSTRTDTPPRAEVLQGQFSEIAQIVERYRRDWAATDNLSEDARRFRNDLFATGKSPLLDDEKRSLDRIDERSERLRRKLADVSDVADVSERAKTIDDVAELKHALRLLLRTNIQFVGVNHSIQKQRAAHVRSQLLGFGLASLVLTALLGIRVQKAIGPRIASIVAKVRRFQETGEYERIPTSGSDEIAVLSNALDIGLSSICDRDRERETFLGVAAHELKTPLTSIVGYADAAIDNPEPMVRKRALEVVRRQAGRLGRLVQDLLLAANARHGKLVFEPKPAELGGLVQRALAEIDNSQDRFELDESEPAFLLADEELIVHALWQILSYASAIAGRGDVVHLYLFRSNAGVSFDVKIPHNTIASDELDRAFQPFASVQYEGSEVRYAVGLYLSREIARVHGGTLHVRIGMNDAATINLELPA